ncbi:DUF4430 domain-containing protein [Natronospora cellulosivora (SeqCode)]
MKKKILTIAVVLILAVTLFYSYNKFLAPTGVEGMKEVNIEVLIESQEIAEEFSYHTDHQFLYELLKENEDEMGIIFEESAFGVMLIGVMNYEAVADRQEFFHIEVNGESAQYGVEELVLNDEDQIKIELATW